MNTKIIRSTLVPGQSKKNPLNSERDNSTYLDGHDERSSRLNEGLGKLETSSHPFREIYCIKRPR
jgi:hypothetical protein